MPFVYSGSTSVAADSKPSSPPQIRVENGMTQPIFSLEDAIVERVFVETKIDSDRDGRKDRVRADIIRPKETEEGMKVPVIYEMSPYRSGILNVPVYDVDAELEAVPKKGKKGHNGGKPAANLSGYYDDYFVPRGYAVVLAESIGTGMSGGCPTTGDKREIEGTKAVIDWLNGRAKAYDADGKRVKADWTTGDVGMTGVSYNGTLPNGVAATGVEGLKTIVPIAAISSWYDYYRANGLVTAPGGYQGEDADNMAEAILTRENPEACGQVMRELTKGMDRKTGDYNQFWKDRDYTKDAKKVEASVFVVHGLNDWNVKTKQFADWWTALEKNKVPTKLWLHQGGHSNPYNFRRAEWLETLNKWFDHWLYDINNDVMDEPKVDIQREDKTWSVEQKWPAAGSKKTRMYFHAEGQRSGELSLSPSSGKASQSFTDNARVRAETLAAEVDSSHRLVYKTAPLTKQVRLSGTPKVSIRASIDRPVANLTALLVRYGTDKTEIITRGWMDPQNLKGAGKSEALKPGKDYTFTWDLQPDDYVFGEGDQIGIVLLSSDYDYTIRPSAGTEITIDPKKSSIELPLAFTGKGL
ncbi:MAG: Xaa-Pro dipeptidyl-peptidase [Bacillus sp. (in: firmicutes)]